MTNTGNFGISLDALKNLVEDVLVHLQVQAVILWHDPGPPIVPTTKPTNAALCGRWV